jgi:hypothetical protein
LGCCTPQNLICTSLIETLYLLFLTVVLHFIFTDDAIICLANYGRLCTSETEHLYFLSYFPLSYFHTFHYMILLFSNTIYGLVYFHEFNICTSKTETSHFSLSLRVLPSSLQMISLFSMQFMGESNFRN